MDLNPRLKYILLATFILCQSYVPKYTKLGAKTMCVYENLKVASTVNEAHKKQSGKSGFFLHILHSQ